MAVSLLARQQEMLRYLAGHIEAEGRAPTRQKLAEAMGQRNKSTSHHMIEELEARGAVRRAAYGEVQLIEPVAVPRAPDGSPLFFVPIRQIEEDA